jgi:AcrR family transcriptional regulator
MAALPEHLRSVPAGRERLPREVRQEHQRDHILSVATEVFAKRGYPETTVDHIVSSAKVGVGSFNSLFDGKEDCFLRAYERVVERSEARIQGAAASADSWPRQVVAVLREILGIVEEEPLRARLALVEVQTAGEKALSRYEAGLDRVADALRPGREFSPAGGELPASLEFAIAGGLAWFLQQRIVRGEATEAGRLLPEALEIVLEPYLGEAQTAALIAV